MLFRVETLGRLRILADGRELTDLRQHRTRAALLVYLAVERSVTRDVVIATFWPESDAENARHALRQALYHLRQSLGDDSWLVGNGDQIAAGDVLSCDAAEFDAAIAASDPARAATLYKGPFLEGVHLAAVQPWQQWVDEMRARRARAYRRACREWVDALVEAKDYARALAAAEAWVHPDPSDGEAQHRLIEVLALAGDRTGAIRQYDHYSRLLEPDGLAPLPESTVLYQSLLPPATSRGTGRVRRRIAISRTRADAAVTPAINTNRFLAAFQRKSVALFAVIGLAAVGLAGKRMYDAAAHNDRMDPNRIAIAPFRVTSPDSSLNYLREGGIDLLSAHLNGEGGLPRAVDSRTFLAHWQRAVAAVGGELTEAQSLTVAETAGAARLLVADVVVTRTELRANGRLLRVPDGSIIAEHTERIRTGTGNEIILLERMLGSIYATVAGENQRRLVALSDSVSAVKAYLAGHQARRMGQHVVAMDYYQRALEVDSSFALAAFHAAVISHWVPSMKRHIDVGRRAWALRDELSSQDRAQLMVHLGPAYPNPSTYSELIPAAEAAARLNPDQPEALWLVGTLLSLWARQAGIDDGVPRGVVALDSALALDPAWKDPLFISTYAALLEGNRARVRRAASRYFEEGAGEYTPAMKWLVARFLRDPAEANAAPAELQKLSPVILRELGAMSAILGLPLKNIYDEATRRLASATLAHDQRCFLYETAMYAAVARGQIQSSLDHASHGAATPGCTAMRGRVIELALVEPAYASASIEPFAAGLVTDIKSATSANDLCYHALWSVAHGDTALMRPAIARMRNLVRNDDPRLYPRVGRLGLCSVVLEAMAESQVTGQRPALQRLEDLHRRGTGWEYPNIAGLMLAGMLERRGDNPRALAAVRRRSYAWNPVFALVLPASLREEGRLAALVGDTSGAIRAYQQYLTLRDNPDPGAMATEVQQVRARLRVLTRPARKITASVPQ